MPFAKVSEKLTGESNFKKTEFIDLPPGISIIRILEPEAHRTYVHYVKGVYIECLGDECPVCKNNKAIIRDNPQEFRKVPEYSSKVERHSVNVYDRTVVKVCKNCGKEHKKVGNTFPSACQCNALLTDVVEQPLNKIKILAKGKELFSQLNVLELSVLDTNKEPLGLQSFDISLFVTGTGRDTKITAVPQVTANDVINFNPEDLFDTKRITFKLSEPEVLDIMNGVQLKDILNARKANKSDNIIENELKASTNDVEATIKELFG